MSRQVPPLTRTRPGNGLQRREGFTLISASLATRLGNMDVEGTYRARREHGQHTSSLTFWAASGQRASTPRAWPTCQVHLLPARRQPEVPSYNLRDS